jgi:hypothetical protein
MMYRYGSYSWTSIVLDELHAPALQREHRLMFDRLFSFLCAGFCYFVCVSGLGIRTKSY